MCLSIREYKPIYTAWHPFRHRKDMKNTKIATSRGACVGGIGFERSSNRLKGDGILLT